ncbi:uncharacterized protein LOC143864825 [Tasmannia lanceolata]|uniref:uncharacterized protein LOC143864825 n=1 Tax=Tasmannia lanceolata TaxID=3420 RepID=UPI004064B3FB
MAYFHKEKALSNEFIGSLEEKVSAFFGELSDESDRSYDVDDDEDNGGESSDPAERTEFWQAQQSLLQEILARSTSSGSRLRREVSRAVKAARVADICRCHKPNSNGCSTCLRQAVVDQLHAAGYDAALCTSKWRSTRDVPSGMHEYIDVVIHATEKKKEARFVIELEFRAEFEIAKACDDYQNLINQLPESYVGKPDHLNTIVRVACDAGKRSMREKKMHMGPWRKRKFMQKKWSSAFQRSFSDQSPAETVLSSEPLMPDLTFNFFFPAAAAVEVA